MRRSAASWRPPHQMGGPPAWRGGGCIVHPFEPEEAPVMACGFAAPQLAHHRKAFLQPRAAFTDRDAAGLELLGKLAADADPEDEPALGQVIEGRNLLGHRRGMAQRQEVDRRAEAAGAG